MIKYCFTVKKLGPVQGVTKSTYFPIWNKWKDLNVNIKFKYSELDSEKKLHYHGLILLPKNYYRKRLMLRGYHTYFKKCYDEKNWLRYSTNSFRNYDKTTKQYKGIRILFII